MLFDLQNRRIYECLVVQTAVTKSVTCGYEAVTRKVHHQPSVPNPNTQVKPKTKKHSLQVTVYIQEKSREMASVLTGDLWRYHIMYYCDLNSLLRLGWTCQALRNTVNEPAFVGEWQHHCDFMINLCRDPPCGAQPFLLIPEQICYHMWEFKMELNTQFEVDYQLRQRGRSVPMLVMQPQMQWQRTPYLNPANDRANFEPGVYHVGVLEANGFYDRYIPMPRMLNVPVEIANEVKHWFPPEPTTYFDLVDQYIKRCETEGRDPYDPANDPEIMGHRAGVWARTLMYSQCVGSQGYIYNLCSAQYCDIEPTEMEEYLTLPIRGAPCGDGMLSTFQGVIQFSGVRYNNEKGDFVPWALSTLALVQGYRVHHWTDCANQFLTTLLKHVHDLCEEVQDDMSMERMAARWQHLKHLYVCMGCTDYGYQTDEKTARRNRQALDLIHHAHYHVYNNMITQSVRRYMENLHNPNAWTRDYLQQLIRSQYPWPRVGTPRRNEIQLVRDIQEMLDIVTYVTWFAVDIGPETDPGTLFRRQKSKQIFLRTGMALLAFAPSWYIDYDYRPQFTTIKTSQRIPHVNMMSNHRVNKYLNFLNRRVLYYHPDPVLQAQAQHKDIGRFHHSSGTSL